MSDIIKAEEIVKADSSETPHLAAVPELLIEGNEHSMINGLAAADATETMNEGLLNSDTISKKRARGLEDLEVEPSTKRPRSEEVPEPQLPTLSRHRIYDFAPLSSSSSPQYDPLDSEHISAIPTGPWEATQPWDGDPEATEMAKIAQLQYELSRRRDTVNRMRTARGKSPSIAMFEHRQPIAQPEAAITSAETIEEYIAHQTEISTSYKQDVNMYKAQIASLQEQITAKDAYISDTQSEWSSLMKNSSDMMLRVASLERRNKELEINAEQLLALRRRDAEEISTLKAAALAAKQVPTAAATTTADEQKDLIIEVEAKTRRLAAQQKDLDYLREKYQEASAAAAESSTALASKELELERMTKRAEAAANPGLARAFRENHLKKAHEEVERGRRTRAQLGRLLRASVEENLEWKKREAAKGMAAATRSTSRMGSRPSSRAVRGV